MGAIKNQSSADSKSKIVEELKNRRRKRLETRLDTWLA
jgi:hypothetical protein